MSNHQRLHRKSYDLIARDYAVKNAAMVPAVLTSLEIMTGYLSDNARILDVGCGHGRETAWFASRGYRTVAFDLSAGMLSQTKALARVPLVQGNMLRLPFCDSTFEGLWCNAALLHIPKIQVSACLTGFQRVLTPGGIVYLALQAGSGEEWESHSYGRETPRFFARYSFDEGAVMLEKAGFKILHKGENRQGSRAHWLHYIARKSG